MNEKTNLKSSGSLSVAGGIYGDVRTSASLKVHGDLECDSLHCSGSTKISGALRCTGKVHCSASAKIEGSVDMESASFSGSFVSGGDVTCTGRFGASGSVQAGASMRIGSGSFSGSVTSGGDVTCVEHFNASGSVQVDGSMRIGRGSFSGSCTVGGILHGGNVSCSGRLRVGKDVEAEYFHSSGGLEIQGLLNAERVDISVSVLCNVADIGGGSIAVKKDWRSYFNFVGKPCLRVRTIEGDDVELEATQASVVRGKRVRIGKDCEVGRVEYSEELIVEGGGVVREQIRL